MRGAISARTYLAVLAISGVVGFALIWAWVAWMPLAFLDPEYPAWLAKERMLARCDLGNLVIVGDSRAAADIEPARLPVPATNLAVGGGEPIEAYAAIRRVLACPHPPSRVIVSFDAGHFMLPDLFWERSVGFGFLSHAEVEQLRHVSDRLGDRSVYSVMRADGLPPRLREALYAIHFPSLYFASLLHGGVALRWWENRATLARTTSRRGQYFFGTADGSDAIAVEGHLAHFAPLPVLDWYFDRTLALLAKHGIAVDFVAMPMNETTWHAVRPALRDGFAAYLAGYTARYANFHVVGPVMPHWPDRLFGDAFSHLNPEGAARLSERFRVWLGGTETQAELIGPSGRSAVDDGGGPVQGASREACLGGLGVVVGRGRSGGERCPVVQRVGVDHRTQPRGGLAHRADIDAAAPADQIVGGA
ncbi:MAG TPA: hypothetical protein VFW75_13290 [Acetobacteraceae bacterium]|nr:hypothetical protein [Acetobacteraceae bacterium]